MSEHDADVPLPSWVDDAAAESAPEDVLGRLLGTVEVEVRRRAEGETTRERAAAIAASLERTNNGTFGLNVPRRPTIPQVAQHRTA